METDKISELRKKLIGAARHKVQEKYEAKDVHIIKAVNILEDLDSISNLLGEQMREWYSVHFPELNEIATDNKDYMRLVHYIGKRDNFTEEKLKAQLLEDGKESQEAEAKIRKIESASKSSMGSDVSEQDLDEMRGMALNCLNLLEEREAIAKYLEGTMKKELPNFTEIAGPVIGAKILAKIGSKKRLAFLPASTLQIVGAEKALFMHFRNNVPGPKYGYLYQHPLVKAASRENKGKISRSIAAKLSIAAKMDYFGSADAGKAEEMMKELEDRAKKLFETKRKEKPAKAKKTEENMGEKTGEPDNDRAMANKMGFTPRIGHRDRQFRSQKIFGAGSRPRENMGFSGNYRGQEGVGGYRGRQGSTGGYGKRHERRPFGESPGFGRGRGFGDKSSFGNNRRFWGKAFGRNRHETPHSRTERKEFSFGKTGESQQMPAWKGGNRGDFQQAGERKFQGFSRQGEARGNNEQGKWHKKPDGKPRNKSYETRGPSNQQHNKKPHAKQASRGDPARKRF